MVAARFFAP